MLFGKRNKSKKLFSSFHFFIIFIAICLIWLLWNFKDIQRLLHARSQNEKEKNDIIVLEKTNDKLQEEIKKLKDDPEYIEKIAREELKLKKPDENRLVIKKEETKTIKENEEKDE